MRKTSSTKETIIEFCKKNNITANQFTGEDKIGGDLYLRSLTSIPEGFNPTVGGYLDLGRTITGACDTGCRDFMQRNNIPFKVENDKTVEVNPIKAKDLLPLLEKSNAYGIERFRSLLTF